MPAVSLTKGTPPNSEGEGASFGAWTLIGVLYITKLITVVLVVWAAHSYETAVLVTVTTWYWLGPLVALGAAPIAFRYRLRKVRARRASLFEQEWSLAESSHGSLLFASSEPK